MKTLILGAKGLLGTRLTQILPGEVVGFDIEDVDVTKCEEVLDLVKKEQPHIVINATAYNDVDGAEKEEGRKIAEAVNGRAPGYIAKAAKAVNATMVHYSSEMVFDGAKKQYNEEDEPVPQNKYGVTKAMGEQAVQDVGGNYYIIRTSRLYGPLPENHKGKKPFINLMLDLAKEKDALQGVDDEASCQTYIADLADFTKRLLEDKAACGIYHGVNNGVASWYEFVQEALKINKINIPLEPVSGKKFPRPANRAPMVELLNTKRPQLRPWKKALEAFFTEFPIK